MALWFATIALLGNHSFVVEGDTLDSSSGGESLRDRLRRAVEPYKPLSLEKPKFGSGTLKRYRGS